MHIKQDFQLFANNPDLVYLDSAATLQKPQSVIDAVSSYLENDYSNIHRGQYSTAQRSEELYRQARKTVATFLNASDESEIVFCANTTDGINLFAQSLGVSNLIKTGDKIILNTLEHHANILPWQLLAQQTGAEIRRVDIGVEGNFPSNKVLESIDDTTKILSLNLCSNITGNIWTSRIKELIGGLPQEQREKLIIVVDASQAAVHELLDVQDLGCDALFFTGHKLGAVTGVGVMRTKKELLTKLKPAKVGGGAVEQVTQSGYTLLGAPDAFEPGTPNVMGAVSLMEAIFYINRLSGSDEYSRENLEKAFGKLAQYEQKLITYCLDRFAVLESVGKINLIGSKVVAEKIGLFSFLPLTVDIGVLANRFEQENIALRTGAHCGHIYHAGLTTGPNCGVQKSCRVSFWGYTEMEDVEKFFEVLEGVTSP